MDCQSHLRELCNCSYQCNPLMCPSYPCVWPELNHIDHLLNLEFNNSLDAFQSYYLNKYVDHHMHETVF